MIARRDTAVVLEDSMSRIDALRLRVPELTIRHAPRVVRWKELLDAEREVARQRQYDHFFLVLDHDLGVGSFEDVDGHNGMSAVQMLADLAYGRALPVLVWSQNDDAARRMMVLLGALGYTDRSRIPFAHDSHGMGAIVEWVRHRMGGASL